MINYNSNNISDQLKEFKIQPNLFEKNAQGISDDMLIQKQIRDRKAFENDLEDEIKQTKMVQEEFKRKRKMRMRLINKKKQDEEESQ